MSDVYSLDTLEVRNKRVEKARFEENRKYRIGFPWVDSNGNIQVKAVQFYKFNEALRRGFLVPTDPDLRRKSDKVMGNPEVRYVTPIIIYRTQPNGELYKGELDFEIMPLVMDARKVAKIKEVHQLHSLVSNDLRVTCIGEKYQDLEFIPVPPSIWKEMSVKAPEFAKRLHDDIQSCVDVMGGAVSIPATDSQIRNWLHIEDTPPPDAAPHETVNLNELSFSASGKSSLDVSDLLKS